MFKAYALDRLAKDSILSKGDTLVSEGGEFTLEMREDGNLVTYPTENPDEITWETRTTGDGDVFHFDNEGDCCITDENGDKVWELRTSLVNGNDHIGIEDDGRLAIWDSDSQFLFLVNTDNGKKRKFKITFF